jgi:hypothetical protein
LKALGFRVPSIVLYWLGATSKNAYIKVIAWLRAD